MFESNTPSGTIFVTRTERYVSVEHFGILEGESRVLFAPVLGEHGTRGDYRENEGVDESVRRQSGNRASQVRIHDFGGADGD